jgi:hypothetical protein
MGFIVQMEPIPMPVRKSAAPQSRKAANRTDELIAALKEAEPIYGVGDALAEARAHVHELRERASFAS